ncbi:DUF3108 domain-containing protein [Methylotenera versatilis]|nr:DUF3108 domain-containing protein [Methylotenera versatilis]
MIKITKCFKLIFSKNKMLTLALVVSLLVHLLLLSKFVLTLPELNEGQHSIEVRLVNAQAMQKISSQSIQKSSQKSLVEPAAAKLKSNKSVVKVLSTINDTPELSLDTYDETVTSKISTLTTEQVVNETAKAPSALEVLMSEAKNETSEMNKPTKTNNNAKKPAPQAYKYVETEFEVRHGNDPSDIGITRIVFNLDKNRTYILTRMTQTQSQTSLLSDTLAENSEGIVTDKGLIPSFYSYQYGKDPKNSQNVRFAWSNRKLQMHSSKADKSEDLSTGTQDSLSYMYQFMFSPPLEDTEITMANGDKQTTYTYSLQGEEEISTKLGKLNTLHLLISDGEEKTELWLGVDYQYLPVRVHTTEKNGSSVDQVVTSIYTSLP